MAPVTKKKKRVAVAGPTNRTSGGKASKSRAARRAASAIERYLSELGLSEQEKNERVSRFADRVNALLARRAKA
jgi:hypothetical protein